MLGGTRRRRKSPLDLRSTCANNGGVNLTGWNLSYRPGWARAQSDELTVYFQVRLSGEPERPRICMVAVSPGGPVTSAVLRSIPLADFENHLMVFASAALPELQKAMTQLMEPVEAGFSAEALDLYFDRADPLPMASSVPADPFSATRVTLERPADGRLTDPFLRSLAAAYRAIVDAGSAPAPAIAEATGASVRTVHGWIAAARKRGFLPPTTRGKAR
jgi:hypothetical protein